MKNYKGNISMRMVALIAGLKLFFPTAPYAEFYVFGRLVNYNDAGQTTQNILNNPQLFLSGIFVILFTFMWDIFLAWAMYIFLRPVSPMWALLGAWFRLVYAALAIVALFNFLYAFHLVNLPGIEEVYKQQQVWQLVNARRFGMHLAYIVFGFYLIIGGVLIYKASYIPKILGILILLAGLSWIIYGLQPYFFRDSDFSWMMYFSVGELAFGIWLLVKGTRIKESEITELK